MSSRTRISGTSLVVYNLRQLGKDKLREITDAALRAMGQVAFDAAKSAVTATDHTLAQLAAMDHPYARRHGSIQVHPEHPNIVHTRSGRLAASLEGKLVRRAGGAGGGAQSKYRVGFDKSPPPYTPHVIIGTKVMLGRDVLTTSIYTNATKMLMYRAAITTLGPVLRSQGGLRFPPR